MDILSEGTRVETVSSPKRKGFILKFSSESGGQKYYSVLFDEAKSPEYVPEAEIRIATESDDPWDKLLEGAVKNHEDFGVTSTFFKVKNNANNTISSLQASRTLFHAHQFKPLIKFLNSVSKRILIADEVGLGKTIEAGHILLEMYSRKQIKNGLVICPKSLQEKWQDELFDKFGFEFKIYETKELEKDLKFDQELNRKSILGIITYDKLKNKRLQRLLLDQHYVFDIIICDEAHLLRNHDTQRHEAIKPIIHNAKYAAMLTATPLCNEKSDLFNILNILEPQRYHNYTIYLNDLEINKPFVKALNSLNRGQSFEGIKKQLTESEINLRYSFGDEVISRETDVTEEFSDDPLYNRVLDKLSDEEESLENKVDIQRDLIELNSLSHIYTRTRKRDVIKERVIRSPHDVFVTFNNEEWKCYRNEEERVRAKYENDRDAILDLINTRRQVASSLPAYYSDKEELEQGIYYDAFEDSKFNRLQDVINQVVVKQNNKLIIFAFFRKTIRYLNLRINEEMGIHAEYMDGSTEERSQMIERFKTIDEFKVLISGSIGAEGLDMQFCDAIVNYNLPWNPMKIEQRIGRVDRIGQHSEKVHIYNLVIRNTVEEKIYRRLLKKIRIFEESLGDLESILLDEENFAKKIQKLERDLYIQELSDEQKQSRIQQTAEATLQEKKDLEKIEEELQQSLINDSYFNNEIERIKNNKRYITQDELVQYLNVLIREALPSCNLLEDEDGFYTLRIPSNDHDILFKFIEKYVDLESNNKREAVNKIYYDFKKQFLDQREIKLTFDQELAFENKKLAFINSYHPLIIAATNFFKEKGYSMNNAYSFSLDVNDLEIEDEVQKGIYVMALNNIVIEKEFNGDKNTFNYLYPVIANPNTEELTFLDDESSEHILGIANLRAKPIDASIDFSDEQYGAFLEAVQKRVMGHLVEKKEELYEDHKIRLESLQDRISKQIDSHFDYQISVREQRLKEEKGIRNIIEAQIEELEKEREERIARVNDSYIEASMRPISVSQIQIF